MQGFVAGLQPGCTGEAESGEWNRAELVVRETIARNHRDTQRAGASEQRASERIVRGAERNAKEDPANVGPRASRLAGELRSDAALPFARLPGGVRKVDDK